jgi:hypothetical protein
VDVSQEEMSAPEDLELDGSEADTVVGGQSLAQFESQQRAEQEISHLANKGYVEVGCMTGGTLMENPKTGHRIAVKFG